jgi:peptidoglycan/xylan/chitin deacetylase (PgdA/CDA1 family)
MPALLASILFSIVALTAFGQQKLVAFTFDDGPNPLFLKKALPYFDSEKIPVTFFVIGAQAKTNHEFLLFEKNQGCEIENHIYGHVCLVKPGPKWTGCAEISLSRALSEISRTNSVIEKYSGTKPRFVRPPYFAMTRQRSDDINKFLEMEVIQHGADSIGSLDWVYSSPEKIVSQVENEAKKRGMKSFIVVFHERLVTLRALPEIISFFRNAGYKFVRLDEYEAAKNGKGEK